MSELPRPHYVVDPEDPRAPPQREWDRMSPEERARVVRELPSSMPEHLAPPPQGDEHYEATMEGREALRAYFAREGRSLYVAADLVVYYPGERAFAPDLLAVADADTRPRDAWVVSDEGRGLDWVLEVLVHGDRRKDLDRNVLTYARLGVREYFIHEPRARALRGYRLASPGVAMYQPIVPQGGAFASRVLGLDLVVVERGRLRFRRGDEELLVPQEVIDRLEALAEDRAAAAEEYERLLAEEREERERVERLLDGERGERERVERLLDGERQRADRAEEELRRLRAELDASTGKRPR